MAALFPYARPSSSSETSREDENEGKQRVQESLDLRALGVRSGNGLNKLDFALVHYCQGAPEEPLYVELLKYGQVTIPPSIRNPLLNMLLGAQNKPNLAPRIHEQLGHMFASGIKTFCLENNIEIESIDFVGTYTPTLTQFCRHLNQSMEIHPQDLNIIVKEQTGLTTAFDFSINERVAGRSATSLVAFVDMLLLRHPRKFRVCLNIDEIATINFIPTHAEDDTTRTALSYDCGPGSLLIDYATRYCTSNGHYEDNDGKFASRGKVNQNIVDRFLSSHDYLQSTPPLHIAREMFGDHEAQRLIDECIFSSMSEADILATVTRITAENILTQYRKLFDRLSLSGQKVDELFICGPSARNTNIVDFLEAGLPEKLITRPLDDIGIQGDANGAVCYAHLALETILAQTMQPSDVSMPMPRQPNNDTVSGKIARGNNWENLVGRVHRFSMDKPLPVARNVRVAGGIATTFRQLGLN